MLYKTSKYRMYSDTCGDVTVHVTPSDRPEDRAECSPKAAVRMKVTKKGSKAWKPKAPLCLGPLHDPHTREGRREAAEATNDFYAHDACGRANEYELEGRRRKRKRRR